PAVRLLRRVVNYLIYQALWLIMPAIFGSEQSFLPVPREAPGVFALEAACFGCAPSGRYRLSMDRPANPACEIVLVHSSDLHVDEDRCLASGGGDGTAGLRSVLATARALPAGIVLLAGDTFEDNQLGSAILDRGAH